MKRVGDLVPTVPKFESCGVCSADGWVMEMCRDNLAAARSVRCRCWRIHMQKVGEALRDVKKKRT